jgi:2-C-methyl-D-erythritol 4-phosphate cytidylyltransferase/2-C-methyl-D-erythritol 2,4-cyclodiphosphate synthase
MKTNEIAIILLAAGEGERCGGILPKQFANINGVSLWRIAYDNLRAALPDAEIVIVGSDKHQHLWNLEGLEGAFQWVEGGATRSDSVKAGLTALHDNAPKYVFVHDAARPFVSAKVVNDLLQALQNGAVAVIPALPATDTIKRVTNAQVLQTLERDELWQVQTPQAFDYITLQRLHNAQIASTTDDAALFEQAGIKVQVVQGSKKLFKVTQAEDLELAQFYHGKSPSPLGRGVRGEGFSETLPRYETISAMGYDVHRLVDVPDDGDAKYIRLGGVDIEHHQKLAGHSDADVVLHSITDSLLGLVAAGDIGQHFPPSNNSFKGVDSAVFLRHAMQILLAHGGELLHIDCTIICESPKIAPHREAIRMRIAEILELDIRRVSIKATTTEGLGFAGRREGIAAQAIATSRFIR